MRNLNQKKKAVSRYFTNISKRYDLMNSVLSFGLHHLWKRKAIRIARIQKGDLILDLCGGTGDLAMLSLKKLRGEGKVILYDINKEMIQQGISKLQRKDKHRMVEIVQGDAEIISFLNDSFDLVMVGYGIRNLENTQEALKEIFRVLKKGGRFVFLEFSVPESSFLSRAYDYYSFKIIPFLGGVIAREKNAYRYLAESIREFYQPHEFIGMLQNIGFSNIEFSILMNGISVIYYGKKL